MAPNNNALTPSWGRMGHYYSVSQKKSSPPSPQVIWIFSFFHKRLRIFNQFLHTYYTFLCTLDYNFLFNYLRLCQSYAILSATT